ncbi:MAG: amidohydrolase family protein, partial [Alphaproteobacteria bacterium]|nr:amidohydrolase family protein [Alphaproteobacteria bacterium]
MAIRRISSKKQAVSELARSLPALAGMDDTQPLLRITGVRVATLDGDPPMLQNTDVWVSGGRVTALLPAGSSAPGPGPVETLAFEDGLVLPGMTNSHSHSYGSLLRGTVPGAPLDLFVMDAMARRAPVGTRQVQVAIFLFAAEMLKCGITGVVDHFRCGALPTMEAMSAAFSAYDQAGMRAAIAPMYEDKVYLDSLPIDPGRLPASVRERWRAMRTVPPADYFSLMEDVVAEWHGRGRSRVLLGVDGPQRCTPKLLELTGAFAAKHGIGLHTHLLEAKTQALVAPADCDGSFVAYLDRFGLIGPRSSLAHFVWCTDRDIELAAERRVNVVHNPVSNLLLGSGLQPAARLLEAGVTVALGSDGASSNLASLFEQARFAMLLSRISQPDCDRWITAQQALRMATVNGAAVMGAPDWPGVVRVGASADLVVVDLTRPIYCPLGELPLHMMMYETGANVDTVLVAGEVVVRQGRCTRINEADLASEAEEISTSYK